jgi:hypothetical protein
MQKELYELHNLVMKDICATTAKGALTPTDYQNLDKAVDIIKDLKTIEAMEQYQETDYEVSSRAMPHYRMNMSNGMSYGDGYYDNQGSYERGRSARTGRYVSMDHDPMMELQNMMATTQDPNERAAIQRVMDRMR